MNEQKTKADQKELHDIEKIIGQILLIGTVISAAVILAGVLWAFFSGNQEVFPFAIEKSLAFFSRLTPDKLIMIGLFLLILTPVLRVAASVFSFLKEKDYLYTWITLLVLFILLLSVFFEIR
ncbi:DUF1634 domain-containing protein [Enterococcus hirae]|nr:DUF1634 domain-containing protein [Enterococcus hirae]